MIAYIPHKDMLLALSKMQRSIIRACNRKTLPELFLIPQYPLFAFDAEKESAQGTDQGTKPSSCSILFPETDGIQLYFPFVIKYADGTQRNLKIIFAAMPKSLSGKIAPDAAMLEKIKNAPEINSDAFPLQLHAFRKALAIMECNSWQIFDDKWFKLQ